MKKKVGVLTDSDPINMIITSGVDSVDCESIIFNSSDNRIIDKLSNIDILFIKSTLSSINSIELCTQIKEDSSLKKIQIVIISSNEKVAEESTDFHANYYLKIPFKIQDVKEVLNQCVTLENVILYVDDSKIFHNSVVPEILEQGYQVITAMDGQQGLDKLRDNRVDLVITDIEMPVKDGYGLCYEIKKSPETNHIPVIMTSTLDSEESIEKGFSVGANDYLTKPFNIPELLNRIQQHLSKGDTRRPEQILLVENDNIVKDIILQALSYNGFKADHVRNGRIALSMLRNKRYQLIITAYHLPLLDGYSLAVQIRQSEKLSKIPIIMLTTNEKRSEQVKLRSVGIQAFIVKPFNNDRLIAEVERVLAQDRLKKQNEMMRHYLTQDAIDAVSKGVETDVTETTGQTSFRTILFTDIEKFTPMCEKLTSQEVVNLLNVYFDEMVAVLIKYDAIIDKFIGDAIMAVFGKIEDGAHRAVCAGLEMIESLDKVQKQLDMDIHMRVGINSGHVILGDIGSRLYRRDFTVIGDNVNTAQRLESNAGRDGVLISDSTYQLIDKIVEATPKELELKGKKEKFIAYQVAKIKPYSG
ncbi:MAG: response regulator [Leptospirales bacterium]